MRTWLQRARLSKSMSLVDVAYHLKVTERAIDSWEKGLRTPSRAHQLALGRLLGSDAIPKTFDQELERAATA